MAGAMDSPSVTPATTRRRRWWWLRVRPIWLVLLGIAVAVLGIVAGWRIWVVSQSCGPTGSGVYKVDGECVGVTDGSYLFESEFAGGQQKVKFAEVQQKIADENARVRAESAVRGASGTLNFSFGPTPASTGVPVGKPIPVLQYPAPDEGPSRQAGPLYCVGECVGG